MMQDKHIEQTTSEELTSELFDIAYTERAGDLVTYSLSKPYAEASGTEEVKGDFTSYITELPGTLKVLIRRLFSAPAKVFGGKSMSQMFGGAKEAYDWLKERVKGGDGIPKKDLPAVENVAHLVENLRVLDDRKITNGDSAIPDGITFARLICDRTFVGENISTNEYIIGELTEINDDSTWDVCVQRITFYDVKKVRLGCKTIKSSNSKVLDHGFFNSAHKALEEIELPNLELLENKRYNSAMPHSALAVDVKIKKLHLPKFRGFTNLGMSYLGIAASCPLLEEIDLPSYVGGNLNPGSETHTGFRNNPELRIIKLNGLTNGDLKNCFNNSPKLIHFEIRDGFNASLNISAAYGTGWSPTMALRTDTDAEDYVDLREDMTMANNLEQFLWNFQHYIADRVADRTGNSALTMTLTSAVYAALQAQDGQTILATLTNKNWNVAQA
jgi:hypothetical protein